MKKEKLTPATVYLTPKVTKHYKSKIKKSRKSFTTLILEALERDIKTKHG